MRGWECDAGAGFSRAGKRNFGGFGSLFHICVAALAGSDRGQRYVETLGMRGRGYRVDEERLGTLRVPGLILMDVAGFRHFVVLKRIDDGLVEVGDPILGNRRIPMKEFLEAWPSRAVFVVIGSDFDRNTVLLQPSARPSARALYARQGPITDAELLDFGFTHADLF